MEPLFMLRCDRSPVADLVATVSAFLAFAIPSHRTVMPIIAGRG